MAIKCGHCKNAHDTIAQVRACSVLHGIVSNTADPQTIVHFATEIPAQSEPKRTPVQRLKDAAAKLPEFETAYYAVQAVDFERNGGKPFFEFYRVDKPAKGKWAGYTFVKIQAGDDFHKLGFQRQLSVVEAIAADPAQALSDYGHEVGRCGVCNRTLTDPESITRGIGPVCAERLNSAPEWTI